MAVPHAKRLLVAIALGTAGFADAGRAARTLWRRSAGPERRPDNAAQRECSPAERIFGLYLAARALGNGFNAFRLAAFGALVGILAFSLVVAAAPFDSTLLFRIGTMMIGFGGGLFTVGLPDSRRWTIAPADRQRHRARRLGGAVPGEPPRASRIAIGGSVRDGVEFLAAREMLGPVFRTAEAGYSVVYHIEIALLVCRARRRRAARPLRRHK